ncbi:MAG: DivIVA domain-containing protein [Actinobacteria bacterium]|nr:DivIVA domain-containing protein [Actinomycetota bacterium]
MADQRPEIRALLTSEAIEHIGFRLTLRGFDTTQVRDYLRRVAYHVRNLQAQTDDLTRRLSDAEDRAENPVLDDSKLAGALGEETARILRSAHEAAADIRGRAEEHVERVVQQARDDSQRLTNEAANILEVRRSAADAEAAEILRTAIDEAARVTAESTAAAAATVAEAQATAEATIEQAKAERNEVLSDVRHRRRVANTQIEQLRAGRERLLQAYDVVRSTLDTVTAELGVADGQAKAAAEEVGRRMNAAIDPLRADSLASTPLVDAPEPEQPVAEPEQPVAESVAVVEPEPAHEPAEPEPSNASAAHGLFERLRTERAESVAAAKETLQDAKPRKQKEKPAPEHDPLTERVSARDETCSGLSEHLTRRIKRALQDEQNLVLDRLRSVRGSVNADSALGAESEHLASYMAITEPALADAARAGAAATGTPIDVPEELVARVANDLAMELVLPLRRQLDERLHEAAAVGDDQITASDHVSSAYREAKTQRVARLANDWLLSAWAVGAHAATAPGTPGLWSSDPAKPCCTDCDDNNLAGSVPAGSAFPTGHLHPPAHPGCRCVVVPTTT